MKSIADGKESKEKLKGIDILVNLFYNASVVIHGEVTMFKNRIDYINALIEGRRVMLSQGKLVDGLTRHINSLLAIYPNKETRIDLHEVFTKEAETPLPPPCYITKKEVFMLQILGKVPEYGTPVYKELSKEFDSDAYGFS